MRPSLDGSPAATLAEGTAVTVAVKATEVAIGTGPIGAISIRNRIPGRVEAVDRGLVMTTVKVGIAGGARLTAAITLDAAVDLGLAVGAEVTLLVKSTEVSVGLD